MIRGDTKRCKWMIKGMETDGNITFWKPTEKDKVYFTCKKDYDSEIAFQKVFPGNIRFDEESGYFYTIIEPKDTNKLPFGTYVYDIEIVINGNSKEKNIVKTCTVGKLEIEKEVTFRRDEV